MRLLLIGHGRMGRLIEELATEAGHTIVATITSVDITPLLNTLPPADVALDFSSHLALPRVAGYVRRTHTPLISGVTGYTPAELGVLHSLAAFAPVLHSANFSLGIAVFKQLLSIIAQTPLAAADVEITETHHNKKADAPSGTAKLLLAALDPAGRLTPVYGREGFCGARTPGEVGMHALRGGTVAGEHTVAFYAEDEILELTHRATSRRIFAAGALSAATLIQNKPAGLYTLEDILFNKEG